MTVTRPLHSLSGVWGVEDEGELSSIVFSFWFQLAISWPRGCVTFWCSPTSDNVQPRPCPLSHLPGRGLRANESACLQKGKTGRAQGRKKTIERNRVGKKSPGG